MTRICEVTGKKPTTGNTVSHAKNKTRRRFLPNLHKRRIWVPSTNTYVTLKVSANGLRLIDKIGVESVLERMRKNEIAETDIARG